jgi:homogentisate phytyltransferase / homogentisate geranylgeranyltransferase
MRLADGSTSIALENSVLFMTAFMAFFSIVIALFKDIPDVRGDRMHDTRTASVRYGVNRVFWVCVGMLHVAYACAVGYAAYVCCGIARAVAIAGQIAFATLLQRKAMITDLANHRQIVDMYMFIWKLFYAQYLLVPFLI